MSRRSGKSEGSGRYVYCIIRDPGECKKFGQIGHAGSEVYTTEYRDFAPVISDVPFREYGVEEEDVEVHSRVIQQVMADHDVLPVAYGMAFKNKKLLMVAMSAGYQAMKKAMDTVDGRFELGVKVFVPRGVVLDDWDGCRSDFRCLEDLAYDWKGMKLFSDRLVLNSAYLLENVRLDAFSARVGELADRYGDLKVRYSGPWPAYNFVDIHILGKKRGGFR